MFTFKDQGNTLTAKQVKTDWVGFAKNEILDPEFGEDWLKDIDFNDFGDWVTDVLAKLQKNAEVDDYWADNILANGSEDRLLYRAYGVDQGLADIEDFWTYDRYTVEHYINVSKESV